MYRQKKLSKQKKCFFIEKTVISIIVFIFILLIGFNMIRAYNYCTTKSFLKPDDAYNFRDNISS